MPEKIPLWVVQNTFKTFGSRMSPMASVITGDLKVCATCQAELYRPADWHYCDEKYYCGLHIEDVRRAQSVRWEQERIARKEEWERNNKNNGYSAESTVSRGSYLHGVWRPLEPSNIVPHTEAEVPAGNLDDYLYQYWVGACSSDVPQSVMTTRSVCRACGEIVFGALGRSIHKSESSRYYMAGFSCMKVISLAIRDLAHLHNCFICKLYTNKKHYGVPLCSPNCHKIWRFNEKMQYPELDLAISPYWLSTVSVTKTGGSTTSESSSSQTPTVTLEAEVE